MAGEPFGDLIAEPQLQIVAVRSDKTHAALEFGVSPATELIEQRGLKDRRIDRARRRFGLDALDAAAVADTRGPRCRCQQLVSLLHFGRERIDKRDACGDLLGTVGGQMPVPHVKSL